MSFLFAEINDFANKRNIGRQCNCNHERKKQVSFSPLFLCCWPPFRQYACVISNVAPSQFTKIPKVKIYTQKIVKQCSNCILSCKNDKIMFICKNKIHNIVFYCQPIRIHPIHAAFPPYKIPFDNSLNTSTPYYIQNNKRLHKFKNK